MLKRFYLIFGDNIFLHRILSIRNSIIAYSIASLLDIVLILYISSIFNLISDIGFNSGIFFHVFKCLIVICIRTFLVLILRRYSFNKIFLKKFKDEELIVKSLFKNRWIF